MIPILPISIPLISRRKLQLLAFLVCLVVSRGEAAAQSDIQFTQYWAVPSYYNPAAAGNTDYLRIRGGARLQWMGIEHAPKSFMGTVDLPWRIGAQRFGAGVNVMQESIGLFSNLLLNLQASYKIRLGNGTLSVGMQGGYFDSRFKGSEAVLPDDGDSGTATETPAVSGEAVPMRDVSGNAFDFSAGIFYTHKYFSVGISGLHLFSPVVRYGEEETETEDGRQFETELGRALYFTADGNIPLKNTLLELQPAMMIKTDFTSFTAEITMRARVRRFISFGVGYRHRDAVSAMVGAEFRNFYLGYSYDWPVSSISKVSSGSHEVVAGYMIKLDFGNKKRFKHRSIRIM